MQSIIRRYKLFKAGEYVPEIHKQTYKKLKIIDQIPEPLKTELLIIEDAIQERRINATLLFFLVFILLGACLGFIMGWEHCKDVLIK